MYDQRYAVICPGQWLSLFYVLVNELVKLVIC